MFGNTAKAAVAAAVAILALAALCAAPASDADASGAFTITDTTGATSEYSGPSDNIIVTGYAATLTLIDAGQASKVYATDQYGKVAFEEKGLEAPRVFSFTFGDNSMLKSNIVEAADNGFDKERDTVLLTTYTTQFVTSTDNLRDALRSIGFQHVLFYGSIYEYEDIIGIVSDIESISGSTAGLTADMRKALAYVTGAVSGLERTDAIFLRYTSAKGWGIGVSGSIGGTLIKVAGGNDLGSEAGATSTLYNQAKIVEILRNHPGAVVFIDSPYFDTYDGTYESFVKDVLGGNQGDFKLVKMLKTWNNYDPESAEGLVEIAHILHPEAVDGTYEVYGGNGSGSDDDDGSALWIGIAAAVIVVLVAAFLIVRSRKSSR